MLKEIHSRLVTKGYTSRSTSEDRLFDELEQLDKLIEIKGGMELKESVQKMTQIVSGPAGVCSCCGK